MMNDFIDQKTISYRVKFARKSKGYDQQYLADRLGLNNRQSISDIENGKRSVKADELIKISDILGYDIEFFLDPISIIGEAQFSWRAAPSLNKKVLNCFEADFGKLIGLFRYLNQADNVSSGFQYPAINDNPAYEDVINYAECISGKLNLGLIPSENITDKIERLLGIPIFYIDIKGDEPISGATCHLSDLNVILINRQESEARQFFDIAHELFHALTWQSMQPKYIDTSQGRKDRIEQLADIFASTLLIPKETIEYFVKQDENIINDIQLLVKLSYKLRVSPVALHWRLHNLGIHSKAIDILKDQKHTIGTNKPKLFSTLLIDIIHDAIRKGKISARKVAKCFNMSFQEFENLFEDYSKPLEL